MPVAPKVLIVGAGIVGAAIAFFLTRAGAQQAPRPMMALADWQVQSVQGLAVEARHASGTARQYTVQHLVRGTDFDPAVLNGDVPRWLLRPVSLAALAAYADVEGRDSNCFGGQMSKTASRYASTPHHFTSHLVRFDATGPVP